MSVQILGLREYIHPKTKKPAKAEKFFSNKWRAPSVAELFADIDRYMEPIPDDERYNLYYTAANCLEESGRKLVSQNVIPFDIDGIDIEKYEEYIPIVLNALGIERENTGIVMSGNGLQFIIGIVEPIMDEEYFDENRVFYKATCGNINSALFMAGMEGNADTSVFSAARLLRLPNTSNIKKDKPERKAFLIQETIKQVPFSLRESSGIPVIEVDEQVHPNMLERLPPPDATGVQAGCAFLQHIYNNQEDTTEPQWYAMLSIIGRLEGGRTLAHKYSEKHPHYSEWETDRKLDQAVEASGPRTCSNISNLWDGCQSCDNWGECNSPITLKSTSYIATRDTGFHNIVRDSKGDLKKGKPNFDDLMLYFKEKHPFCTQEDGNMVHIYDGIVWKDMPLQRIYAFAEDNFDPKPTNAICKEFHGKLTRNDLVHSSFFSVDNYINFSNGVLNLENYELLPHSKTFGFKYSLPFPYDPSATCERFDRYLDEVTLTDDGLKAVLLEYMGYSLSGMDSALGQKALILTGDGSNGKSVFLDVLKHMAGEGNYSTLSMGYEISKLENRYHLDGKLFNISEETPDGALLDSSIFKALVTGGEVQARKLYHDSYSLRNRAKIIMACNQLPPTKDLTHGMFRRLLIVPFNATFTEETMDIHIREKLYAEASGIFNRVLVSLKEFKERRAFYRSKTISKTVDDYRNENDYLSMWFEDCTVKDADAVSPISEMYQMYKMDSEMDGMKPMTVVWFSRSLAQMMGKDAFSRKMIGKKQSRVVHGIRLMEETDEGF